MLYKILIFNFIIRTFIECYFNLCFSSFIQVTNLSYADSMAMASSAMSIMLVAFVIGFPIFIMILMSLKRNQLDGSSFRARCGSLYSGIRVDKYSAVYMSSIFLGRRILFVVTSIILTQSVNLQLIIQTFYSLFYIAFLIGVRPFVEPRDNYMEIFNDFSLMASMYFCYVFTDFVPDAEMRYSIGKGFNYLILFNIGCNMGLLLLGTAQTYYKLIKKLIALYKNWKKKRLNKN